MTIEDYVRSVERLDADLHDATKWSHRLEMLTIGVCWGAGIGLMMLVW